MALPHVYSQGVILHEFVYSMHASVFTCHLSTLNSRWLGKTPQSTWRYHYIVTALVVSLLLGSQIHKEMCPNKRFLCAHGCGRYVLENDLETHMSSECPKRPSTCKYCKKNFPLDSMQVLVGVYTACQVGIIVFRGWGKSADDCTCMYASFAKCTASI